MTMWKRLLAVLAFNFLWTASVHAQEGKSSVKSSPEAIQLAEILVTANLSEASAENALGQMTAAMFAQQPDLVALETTYPGMKQTFVETMRPFMNQELKRIYPLYVTDLAILFSANFTTAELQNLSRFWQSPPAQSVLKSAIQNVGYAAISTEIVDQINNDEDIAISQAAVDQDLRGAIKNTVSSAGEVEQAAFLQFAMTPEGRKFLKLKDEKKAIDLKWMNAPTSPEVDEQIEAAILSAMEDHMRRHEEREAAKPTT